MVAESSEVVVSRASCSSAERAARTLLPAAAPAWTDDLALQQALDRVATCAAVSLRAPLAAVAMVEADAVRFAGMHGFDRRRTVRAGSFSDAVVRFGGPLLIDDARIDPRVRMHEFVDPGGVRAYAGAPIASGEGAQLGALGVFAAEPDAFSPACLADLEALAHMVELLLLRAGPGEIELPRLRRQGWIGVRTLDARRSGSAARAGLVILSVARGSPAEQIGLRATDILYAADDLVLCERADLLAALADREPGSWVRLAVQRAGQWFERWVKVESRCASQRRATLAASSGD